MYDKFPTQVNRREAMVATATTALMGLPVLSAEAAASPREILGTGRARPFDHGWKFQLGVGDGYETAEFDDQSWRTLDLPHDWSIEDLAPGKGRIGPFDRGAEGAAATGYTVGGEGWYRKRFRLDALPEGGRAEICFGGVYNESEVWLNGKLLGRHVYGYTPFRYDLTPHLKRGSENVLAVRVLNFGKNSRWYSGSGIYRSVTLSLFREAARIAPDGIVIVTRRIAGGNASIAVDTPILTVAKTVSSELKLVTRVKNASGKTIAEATLDASANTHQTFSIDSARLWSPDTPTLYTLESELRHGSVVVDSVTTLFGIRIVTIDARRGFMMNGHPLKLRGGCVHHDNGLLGAAAFADAEDRKVRLLRARGYNAIRGSHNPSSDAFREACDRHGMMLIEEAFDMWQAPKTPQDYSTEFRDHWQEDLTAMILAARNNPCVIMWSIGNEIPERSTPEGVEYQWKLANHARKIDPTRPVAAGINAFFGRELIPDEATARPGTAGHADQSAALFLDVVGYNYQFEHYEADHARYPNRVMFGSESFAKDVFAIWKNIEAQPFVIGDFVWTAIDYLGEAATGGWLRSKSSKPMAFVPVGFPWVTAYCGDIDLLGMQRPASFARDVVWGISPLEVAVQRPLADGVFEHLSPWAWSDELQSWSWPGSEGQSLAVRIYANADRVEVRLNGVSVGNTTHIDPLELPLEFKVPYSEGKLEAVAYRGGKEIARRVLETVGPPVAVRLVPEPSSGRSGRDALRYVMIEIVDAQGRRVPDAVNKVRLMVSGPAELIGFGNGGPIALGSFQSPEAQTYHGCAMAIFRGQEKPGTVLVRAVAPDLKSANTNLNWA